MKQLEDLNFLSGARITDLPNGTDPQHPATVAQLNSYAAGQKWKEPSARVRAQGNINLSAPGASINGIFLIAGDTFLAPLQTTTTENGIYIWTGAVSAATRRSDADTFTKLEAAVISIEEGTDAGTSWRQTQVNGVIGTDPIAFANFGTTTPDASETVAGKVELSTTAEGRAGINDTTAMTPAKVQDKLVYHGVSKFAKFQITGDGSTTSFTITHNYNTRDVACSDVKEDDTPYGSVGVGVANITVNTTVVSFAFAPANAVVYNVFLLVAMS